ncbi:hypothetical protein BS47DRAFT_568502 [Hydnum rufescens UP504]|uniref:Uncharacterized protein n=1 Tax=Hydnum rufescens UP504 TaxID=1448309 RepID=A0A9P6B3W3_9AGAM|nr:hypothetical protein BS47DRAFT_568502 [Hydnum rufescens UP504]
MPNSPRPKIGSDADRMASALIEECQGDRICQSADRNINVLAMDYHAKDRQASLRDVTGASQRGFPPLKMSGTSRENLRWANHNGRYTIKGAERGVGQGRSRLPSGVITYLRLGVSLGGRIPRSAHVIVVVSIVVIISILCKGGWMFSIAT